MDLAKEDFEATFVLSTKELKAEDVAFVEEKFTVGDLTWSLYCVCDGHGGVGAANFVRDRLLDVLRKQLPDKPPDSQPKSRNVEDRIWATKIAKSIASAFCSLDESFAETRAPSGTTISLALLCGSLLTIANVGDSEVFLDTGQQIFPMTECHKVDTSTAEQTRLRNAGATLSACITAYTSSVLTIQKPIGPLRVWPGGIAVSRSLGDFECSRHVIPNAHIKQIVVPKSGARLIMASDGLWDHVSGKRACKLSRYTALSRTPTRLFRALMSSTKNCLVDDTTMLVVDFLPKDAEEDFPTMCKRKKSKGQIWTKLRNVLRRASILNNKKQAKIYADLDTAVAFPSITSKGHSIYHSAGLELPRRLQRSTSNCRPKTKFYNEETNRWTEETNGLIEIACLK